MLLHEPKILVPLNKGLLVLPLFLQSFWPRTGLKASTFHITMKKTAPVEETSEVKATTLRIFLTLFRETTYLQISGTPARPITALANRGKAGASLERLRHKKVVLEEITLLDAWDVAACARNEAIKHESSKRTKISDIIYVYIYIYK